MVFVCACTASELLPRAGASPALPAQAYDRARRRSGSATMAAYQNHFVLIIGADNEEGRLVLGAVQHNQALGHEDACFAFSWLPQRRPKDLLFKRLPRHAPSTMSLHEARPRVGAGRTAPRSRNSASGAGSAHIQSRTQAAGAVSRPAAARARGIDPRSNCPQCARRPCLEAPPPRQQAIPHPPSCPTCLFDRRRFTPQFFFYRLREKRKMSTVTKLVRGTRARCQWRCVSVSIPPPVPPCGC